MNHTWDTVEEARRVVAQRCEMRPSVGLILGSGLGHPSDAVANGRVIPYGDIPHFPRSTVPGHQGKPFVGTLFGRLVMVVRGRFHLCEGYSPAEITLPVRVMRALGVSTLVVTNAAGGLHADWQAGDLMAISDHIGFPVMAGANPLRGANDERFGTRFPALTLAYDTTLRAHLHAVADQQQLCLRDGVYAQVAGPSFETPAELRMLQRLGADAVGMSTVPEVVVAVHSGMRVVGISLITNIATPDAPPASHAEVLATGQIAGERFSRLVLDFLAALPADGGASL
ncbi:MAG: purine-nucleoside phosphorylase [Herpetosiphon sp.]